MRNLLIMLGVIVSAILLSNTTVVAQKNLIFRGGPGDGYAFAKSLAGVTSIYKGGTGDGWAQGQYLPANTASSNIYRGGAGDGWSFKKNATPVTANLYAGGIGDGWARQDLLPSALGDLITEVDDKDIFQIDFAKKDIYLYPIPASKLINIKLLGNAFKNEAFLLRIINSTGSVVYSETITANNDSDTAIEIPTMSEGFYSIQAMTTAELYIKSIVIVQ